VHSCEHMSPAEHKFCGTKELGVFDELVAISSGSSTKVVVLLELVQSSENLTFLILCGGSPV